jgi:hypothetical protein
MTLTGVDTNVLDLFSRYGVLVLRTAFDPIPLASEFERVDADAFGDRQTLTTLEQGREIATFRYAPMMCERTPVSLSL